MYKRNTRNISRGRNSKQGKRRAREHTRKSLELETVQRQVLAVKGKGSQNETVCSLKWQNIGKAQSRHTNSGDPTTIVVVASTEEDKDKGKGAMTGRRFYHQGKHIVSDTA
jgi:hypothetical protein